MTTAAPSIAAVRGWRVDALHAAADGGGAAGDALEDAVNAVRLALDGALRD